MMIRSLAFGFAMFAALGSGVAQDPRAAIIDSLKSFHLSQSVHPQQISLPSKVAIVAPKVQIARYDKTLKAWIVDLRCAPPGHCLPSLATISIDDPSLISAAPLTNSTAPIIVRAGDRRYLVSNLGSIRISEPAVCLQSGRIGQQIRVRVTATRAIKRALVSSSGELRLVPSL